MLYPMFAMVLLTFVVMFTVFIWRVRSVKNGTVKARYYKLMRGDDVPDYLIAGERHFANLFETPVLFYVVCCLALILKVETMALQALAWVYIALRVVHAYIHLSYNHILHRLLCFWVSILIILAMWVLVLISH